MIIGNDLGEQHVRQRCGRTVPCTAYKVRAGGSWSHIVRRHGASFCVAPPLFFLPPLLTLVCVLVLIAALPESGQLRPLALLSAELWLPLKMLILLKPLLAAIAHVHVGIADMRVLGVLVLALLWCDFWLGGVKQGHHADIAVLLVFIGLFLVFFLGGEQSSHNGALVTFL